ncbi:hypothetical protein Q73_11255 [Bacillus coahuilensis m2-6]|uniref:PepSY domain-containing protein n=1 Tax=Bacillus coahuilensis TaxID=408580 RepID=UPI0007502DA6|nr:PepSY domain-containing protein [Bacillus coahuilensis]KUP06717.1 hypothetical protein Q73_11255 [Bacillus coahuilensis m2-6]
MNWKSLLIGTIAGFAGGYLVKELSTSSSYVSSEAVLEKVKKAFREKGPIDGSWIHMEPEDYVIDPVHTKVYRGGIMRQRNGQNEQFEFIADAKTGSILRIDTVTKELQTV